MQAAVTAYGSGNAAQVYFELYPRKIKLSELEAAYPGMVDALVAHEGLGMVLGYEDDMTAVVLGKGGKRNLHTGEVVGVDPVAPYAPAEGHGAAPLDTRVWQLKRVMDFPSAGDLWLISTIYPDGTVAALEELVGNHGGVGGEQTDAFIFHPPDLPVPETRCSTDVFHILNGHRNAPVDRAAGQPRSAGAGLGARYAADRDRAVRQVGRPGAALPASEPVRLPGGGQGPVYDGAGAADHAGGRRRCRHRALQRDQPGAHSGWLRRVVRHGAVHLSGRLVPVPARRRSPKRFVPWALPRWWC